MGTTTTDDQQTWLRAAGFTGSMDDMIFNYLKTQQVKTLMPLATSVNDYRWACGVGNKPFGNPTNRTPVNMGPPNKQAATDTAGWIASGSGVSIARVTDAQFIIGSANPTGTCIEVTNANAGITAIVRANVITNWVPIIPGRFYSLSGYVKWVTGTLKQARLDIFYRDATGVQISTAKIGTLNTISAGGVTAIVNNDNLTPEGATYLEARAVVPGAAAGDVFRASNFFVEIGNYSTAPPYN